MAPPRGAIRIRAGRRLRLSAAIGAVTGALVCGGLAWLVDGRPETATTTTATATATTAATTAATAATAATTATAATATATTGAEGRADDYPR